MTDHLHMEAEFLELRTRHPFIIARGNQSDNRTVWVRLRDEEGHEGWGEAAPSRFYGETPETVMQALDAYAAAMPSDPFDVEETERRWELALHGNPSARAALSSALHDLVGKRLGVPVYRLWGLDPARAPRSTFTIGLDTPDRLRLKVREAEPYPILKIKVGTDRDLEVLQHHPRRDRQGDPGRRQRRLDPEAGDRHAAGARGVRGHRAGAAAAPDRARGLAEITRRAEIPVIADESCLVASDIPPLVGCVDGINIKLAKCGSLREALRMIAVARAHGMMVMVGCMIESSICITAAAHFTPLVDLVDLDGAALLAEDPFVGATIDGGQVRLPDGPGLGLRRR